MCYKLIEGQGFVFVTLNDYVLVSVFIDALILKVKSPTMLRSVEYKVMVPLLESKLST